MKTTYYIKNANGTLLSTDGKTAFIALQGEAAYEYLNSEEGRGKYFFRYMDDCGDVIAVEADEELYRRYNREQKAVAYHEKCNRESGKTTVSIDDVHDDMKLSDCIEDETINLESTYEEHETREALRRELANLPSEECEMITQLYLLESPLSEREYARCHGLSQTTVNYRKRRTLEKLKALIA